VRVLDLDAGEQQAAGDGAEPGGSGEMVVVMVMSRSLVSGVPGGTAG
jgi:hypothetical protein